MKALNNKGSTLVECIAAFALFTLASFILLSGFLTAANLVVKAGEVKENSNKIINAIQTDETIDGVTVAQSPISENLTFTLGGDSHTATGKYRTASTGALQLTMFIPDVQNDTNIIPGTGIEVNGGWPEIEKFYNDNGYPQTVRIEGGKTFVYDGEYYIAAQDLNIYDHDKTPTPTNGWWYESNSCLVQISDREVITLSDNATKDDFNNLTEHFIDWGNIVLYKGSYYVYTVKAQPGQTVVWAELPTDDADQWAKIT